MLTYRYLMHFSERCFWPTPGPSVNPLYSNCEILKFAVNIKLSNFLFAHDSIKSNLPTSFCDSITINIPILLQKSRTNQANTRTVRTKTSGSNSIKSKSANIWKFLQIFINRLFYNGLCLTVPLLFIIYLFFVCMISAGFTCSCIYVSHGLILYFFGGQVWTSYMPTDCLSSNCKKIYFWRIHTYLLTYLLKKHHHTQTSNFSNFLW